MNAEPAASAQPKVLVVDDDPIVRHTIKLALKDHGYEILAASQIAEALHIVRSDKPDLILLDINFPPDTAIVSGGLRDGFWALEWMGYLGEIKGVPIVMISGEATATAKPQALAVGAADYLQKPIKNDELLALIAKLLGRKPAA
jgi:CheY-like chemotaxis protein